MHQNKHRFIIMCENCDHADICRILNPYQYGCCFILATSTNFCTEELERVDHYLSLISSSMDV